MKVSIASILIIGTLCFSACKGSETTSKEEVKSAVKTEAKIDPNCTPVILEAELYNKVQNGGVQALESKIEGNYLYLKYTFSGCPSDEILLVWNSMLLKSYPGKAMIKLGFEETGSCDEMQTQEACYDLKDFVQYKKVYLIVNDAEAVLYDVVSE